MKLHSMLFALALVSIAALSTNDAVAAATQPVSVTFVIPAKTSWGSTGNICKAIFIGSGGPSEIGGNAYLQITSGHETPVTYGACQVGPFSMLPATYTIEMILKIGTAQRAPIYAKAKVTARSNGKRILLKLVNQ